MERIKIEWDGGKLSKRRALYLCWKLWEWLGLDAKRGKGGWPGWRHNGGATKVMNCGCPCCQYAQRNGGGCGKCLLVSLWPHSCCFKPSRYDMWEKSHGKRKTDAAKKIAAEAKRLYHAEMRRLRK